MWWTKISNYVTIGLGAAFIATSVGWYMTDVRLNYTKSALVIEKLGRKNDKLTYEKAQKDAEVLALNKVIEVERKNAEEARKADEAYAGLLSKYNASIVRYQAAHSAPSTIHLSGSSESSDGNYTSSESTEILITLSDAHICAENTARLESARQWAKQLGLE